MPASGAGPSRARPSGPPPEGRPVGALRRPWRAALHACDPGRAAGRFACALASGGLLTVAGRPWGLGWLALIALVPLLAGLRREPRARHAALHMGAAALAPAFVVYEAIGPFAPAAVPALALAASLPFAAAGALVPRARRALGTRAALLAFPLLWLAAETLPGRPWLLGRFAVPLFAVGYTQAGLPTMQLARWGGVGAVGLVVLAVNALVALTVLERVRWAPWGLAAALLCLAALGWDVRLAPRSGPGSGPPKGAPRTVTVRIVQEALPDAAYALAAMLPGARAALVSAFVRDSLGTPRPSGPGLDLWPEGALPGPLSATGTPRLALRLARLGPTLAGAPARLPSGVANAAFAWHDGALDRVYAKRRLAPLTEDALVPGTKPGLTWLGGVRVAPLICFEAAFPDLSRDAANGGAELLAVLTNDAFGRFLGTPVQHLRLARFRAVETGLPLAFASNAGPSAVIDGRGRLLGRTPAGAPAVLVATPRLAAGPTPYLRWGDWPGTVALAGAGLLALLSGARGGSARS